MFSKSSLVNLALFFLTCTGVLASGPAAPATRDTWMADNGNGTFTNPLFYEEFSDPDLIRVGNDYYLTGTTMHTMPGLPILHSRDLVNWRFVAYACDRLDLGPQYRLEGGEIYGQGIWAPCFRYHDGTFIIFSNVNGRKTQVFRSKDPAGPWTQSEMRCSLHDLSVLFDDDGRIFAVWGYNEVMMAELEPDLSDVKPGTQRVLMAKGSGMGEGSHFYKIKGRYYIFSTNYDPTGYMVCARSDRPEGPYELAVVSARETLGNGNGWRVKGMGRTTEKIELEPPQPSQAGAMPMHQGGIVETPLGEWWGFSMMDFNSIGRTTCLSPVTWTDDWPYFGLPGNLTRSPQTWLKPKTDEVNPPSAPYKRSDDFSQPRLQPIWQWNHVPVDDHWSLSEKPGSLRLHPLPATDFFHARNTLTQRAVGPESNASVEIDASGLKPGDIAGLGLLNYPYVWIGVVCDEGGLKLESYNQLRGETHTATLSSPQVKLRVHCNFDDEKAQFSFSQNDQSFQPLGTEAVMAFQPKTFQGVRFALFAFSTTTKESGGIAEFAHFRVEEPRAGGVTRRIPIGKAITLTSLGDHTQLAAWNGLLRPFQPDSKEAKSSAGRFRVLDRGVGRIALSAEDGSGYITVTGIGAAGDVRLVKKDLDNATTFQWQDMLRGDVMLMSLTNHRYLRALPNARELVSADSPGAEPDRKNGSCFIWTVVEP